MNAIQLEVMRHLFSSIAEEMGVSLMRSAFSPNIKERRDYSCAIFDASGEMVAQAAGRPDDNRRTGAQCTTFLAGIHPADAGGDA